MTKKRVFATKTVENVEIVYIALRNTRSMSFKIETLGLISIELLKTNACGDSWCMKVCRVDEGGGRTNVGSEEEAEKKKECSVYECLQVV